MRATSYLAEMKIGSIGEGTTASFFSMFLVFLLSLIWLARICSRLQFSYVYESNFPISHALPKNFEAYEYLIMQFALATKCWLHLPRLKPQNKRSGQPLFLASLN